MALSRSCHNVVRANAETWTLLSSPRNTATGKARGSSVAPSIRLYRHQGADFDDRVVVSQDRSKRWYEQSRISAISHQAKHEYARVMVELLPDDRSMEILVLGCGGASIPHDLAHHKPMIRTTVVDNSLAMIELAKYLIKDKSRMIKWQHAEAEQYVETTKTQFDLIICDIFDIDSGAVPEFTSSQGFLSAISQRLKIRGSYVQNLLANPNSGEVCACIRCCSTIFQEVQTHVCSSRSDSGTHNILISMKKRDDQD